MKRSKPGTVLAVAALCAAAAIGASADEQAAPTRGHADLLDLLHLQGVAHLEEAVPVTLRDGTVLAATVVVPNGAAAASQRPTLLIQTPYADEARIGPETPVLTRLAQSGYVLVIVNDRGTGWSEGEYHWMKGAQRDGVDTLDWITQQPWSNGKVGTMGCSSSGEVTIPLALASPPALKAVVAMGAATAVGEIPGFADQGIFYMGGVPSFDWAWWYHGFGYHHHPKLPHGLSPVERAALARAFDTETHYPEDDLSWADHLPSATLLDAIGSPETEFNRLITLEPASPEWQEYDFLNAGAKTSVPILHVDSWYDTIEVYGTTRMFQYLSGNSPNQYLIVGGTGHCHMGQESAHTVVGKRPIGDGRFDYTSAIVHWFDHWLRDDGRGKLDLPKVQYYAIESNRWTSAPAWPVPATDRKLYLASGGHANALTGDGVLHDTAPGPQPADIFVDDPARPVPTLGGGCCTDMVALDQTGIEMRSDVLVYTTPPFAAPLDIAGYVQATLYLASSAVDGDLMVKFVDVYPDGRAFNITDTALRLRYREGIYRAAMMTPGEIYQVTLGQMVIASHFDAGHRIRLEIAGTNFPEYERNLHSGGRNYDETEPRTAQITLYHDADHASFLQIPVAR